MATLTAVNPRVVGGPVMQTVKMLVENGQSWKAGQFLFGDDGGQLNAAASAAVAFNYFALTDQTDPGNDTTLAEVGIIDKDHIFEMNELDGAVTTAAIGLKLRIDVTSNVVTVDLTGGSDTTPAVKVIDVASEYAPLQNSASDVKGRMKVHVLQSVLDADSPSD